MSQLNKNTVKISATPFGLGVSKNGNVQAIKGPQHELFDILVSSLYGKDSFYETADKTVERMKLTLNSVIEAHGVKGAEYAARVAIFAREQMHIRTMPIVMMVELAKIMQSRGALYNAAMKALEDQIKLGKTDRVDTGRFSILYDGVTIKDKHKTSTVMTVEEMVTARQSMLISPPSIKIREYVKAVISRADELTDLFAYSLTVFKSTKLVPMGIKRGVADAFNKFDAYQLGKYNRAVGLTLKDLLRIVHPVPATEDNSVVFKKIMDESLESPYTWEVELSKNGQLGDKRLSDKDIWTALIDKKGSGSLGYMAILRNLRNMKEAGISNDTWKEVAARIRDPKAVEKSKQLPFGFINSYDVAKASNVPSLVLNALQEATELSLGNMPKLGERVWIILDCSGSMNSFNYSSRHTNNNNSPIKIGAIFSAALVKASKNSFESSFVMFDDYAKTVNLNPMDSLFTLYEKIMSRNAGGGTNLSSALSLKPNLGFEPDTVVIISDMQVNNLRHDGLNIFKPNCTKVAINLGSLETTPCSEWSGWTQLGGWSPRIFQFVKFSKDSESIVQQLFDGTPVAAV